MSSFDNGATHCWISELMHTPSKVPSDSTNVKSHMSSVASPQEYFLGLCDTDYSTMPLWRGQFSPKFSQDTSHSSPVRARYGMYFVGSNSGSCFASVTTVMYAISYYIGPRYNGTRHCYFNIRHIVIIIYQLLTNHYPNVNHHLLWKCSVW